MPDTEIHSKRLLLRQWKASDLQPFLQMCADAEVMRYIGAGKTMNRKQVQADIAGYEDTWQRNGYGQFAVELKAHGKFIGFAGLSKHTLLPIFQSSVEIGWRFSRKEWGKGYATEAAKAVLAFAVDSCQIKDIISVCQVENDASERIMQKIGMEFETKATVKTYGRAIKVYRLLNC